ncbi:MAG: PDZ domain-containing protein [Chloroflexi bacterium]|nr:PDZ domain-containing protein [Chloroflexota bacterium]
MRRSTWTNAIAMAVVIIASMTLGGLLAVNVAGEREGVAPASSVAVATATPADRFAPAATAPPIPAARPAATSPATAVTPAATPAATPTATASPSATPEAAATPTLTGEATAALPGLPDLVEQVMPSIVRIRVGSSGTGSGIVIDRDGHILTNRHVIEDATSIVVELRDGTTATAEVMGADAGNDLAVIRADLPVESLTAAAFGDSGAVRVGEPVFAIGNPFGLGFTVTSGIISGLGRESDGEPGGHRIRGVLQTDAAVNPGNSGGPLFNGRGQVIGINTALENPYGQRVFVGVGYAVPSNTALRFIPALIAGEEIEHPQLGIAGVGLDVISAEDAGLDIERGVYITHVVPDRAADAAGLVAASEDDGSGLDRGGDVITAIDGVAANDVQELARIIDSHDVGDTVSLTVVRAGESITVEAVLRAWITS